MWCKGKRETFCEPESGHIQIRKHSVWLPFNTFSTRPFCLHGPSHHQSVMRDAIAKPKIGTGVAFMCKWLLPLSCCNQWMYHEKKAEALLEHFSQHVAEKTRTKLHSATIDCLHLKKALGSVHLLFSRLECWLWLCSSCIQVPKLHEKLKIILSRGSVSCHWILLQVPHGHYEENCCRLNDRPESLKRFDFCSVMCKCGRVREVEHDDHRLIMKAKGI